jgi:hypothetical protein
VAAVVHTNEYVALLETFSGHITMDAGKRERLYQEIRERIGSRLEQRVRWHWYAILHVARRKPSTARRSRRLTRKVQSAGGRTGLHREGGGLDCGS